MNKIEFGDCRDTMRRWAADGIKVQTCITSPPYFGLRDYGHEGQIGLEQTPEEYIAAMVEVFRCVRDVLADDGTLWLNIGDSYVGSANNGGTASKTMQGTQAATGKNLPTKRGEGLKRSGTTAQVALQHERNYLGCELNTEYKPLQDERISKAIENKSPQLQLLPA